MCLILQLLLFVNFFINLSLCNPNQTCFHVAPVCGQGDAFETVQVKEGEVLNLHPGVDLTEDDQIQWSYESGYLSTRIAKMNRGEIYTHYEEKFAGRVQIDKTTGVLSISNIRTNETGLFEAFIIINTQISEKKFNVEVLGKF